jgi:iron complex outermembrane receptor protein
MYTKLCFVITLGIGLVGQIRAQPADSVSVRQLSEMSLEDLINRTVTTSTQTSVALNKAPSNIYTFTGDEIRRYGIRNLNELLSTLVPGVINTEDGDESISSFRGVATDNNAKVLMLVDGHKINPQWAKGATPEFELGFLEDIDKVEVIVGPGSALYGSGATIGVVNIITKTAEKGNRFSAYTSYGTGNYAQVDASAAVKMNNDLSVSMSLGVFKSDGYPRRDGSSNDNSPLYISKHPMSDRLGIKVNYKNTEVSTRYTSFGRSLYNTIQNPLKANPYEIWDYFYAEIRQLVKINDQLNIRLGGAYDAHQTRRFDYLKGFKVRAIGENHISGNAKVSWIPSDKTCIIIGGEYSKDAFGADWYGDNYQISPTFDTTSKTININPTYANRMITPYKRDAYGGYGQITQNISDKISLLGGFRYDYIYAPNQSKNSAITPRVGIVYTPIPKLTTKLMFSTGFRQAMAVLTDPDKYFIGNAANYSEISTPEQIYSTELSVSYLINQYLNASVNLFYNRFNNLHNLAPADTSGPHKGGTHFVSAGTMDFKGVEATIWCKIANRLTAKFIQQYVSPGSKVEDPYHVFVLPTDKNQLMFYPENTTKFLLDVQIWSWLSANTNLVIVYKNYGYNSKSVVTSSGQYTILNANIVINTRKFIKGDLILSGYNLLDANPLIPMPTAPGTGTNMVPIAGRNFNISYRMSF